jgi:Flp pilus assembly pilin Flp
LKPRTTSYAESLVELCDRLVRDETGRNLSEYAVLLAVVGVAGVLAFWTLRQQIDGTFARVPR